MSGFVPKKLHLREVLLHYFLLKKNATETFRLLRNVYGEHAPSERSCREWFQRFKAGDFDVNDKHRDGAPTKFEDEELKALLDEDCARTLEELSVELGVVPSTVSKRLKAMGMVQKAGNWLPKELKERDIERRLVTCEILLQRQQKKGFLHRIITGDEKWIHYDNPKRKKGWVPKGSPGPSTPKRNIHGSKIMLCIWWDQRGWCTTSC